MRKRAAILQYEESIAAASETAEGATITDFSMPTPDGTSLSIMSEISQHRITIIDFWASWYGPCRRGGIHLGSVFIRLRIHLDPGIVGISLDESKDDWMAATKQLNITWPQVSDLQGWDNAAARKFSVTSIPHTIVVNQQGKILRLGLRGESLAAFVAEQLD